MLVDLSPRRPPFGSLSSHLRSLISELEGATTFHSEADPVWYPRVNLYEAGDRFLVCVDLAGMVQEQIDVQVEGRILHLRGNRPRPGLEDGPRNVSVHLMEIDSGRFHRKVGIPCDVDVDRIGASYRNGYLWVTLPRLIDSQEHHPS